MKIKPQTWIFSAILFALCFMALSVFGQTNAPPVIMVAPTANPASKIMLTLIPILVPMLIALLKVELPKIPSWLLPILAPAIGALIDWLTSLATGTTPNPIASAVLGAAGVGLREIYDQTKNKISPPKV